MHHYTTAHTAKKYMLSAAYLANVVQVVVLASSANALLAVASPRELAQWQRGVHSAKEQRLELVHASIGKKQRWVIVWHHSAVQCEWVHIQHNYNRHCHLVC
jgi:regulator of extracellular matrix RemA (YlzA/DUF370 family)